MLQDNRLNINQTTKRKDTPLHIASSKGHIEIIKLLMTNPNLEINPKNTVEETPLYKAAKFGYNEVIKLLLAAGADSTIKTKKVELRKI